MLDQLIRQLDDADPARRKQAVIALGKSRDASALKPLANVYRSDPEPEIRELARKAGVYIKQHAEVIPDVPATTPPMPKPAAPVGESYTQRKMREMEEAKRAAELAQEPRFETQEADTRRPIRGREYQVPKEARERAAKAVDAALSYNLAGDDAKAMKNLTEAISLNPNLINDAYFNSITAGVTGLDGDAAMDMILDRGKRKEFEVTAKNVTKQAKIDKHMEVATKSSWTDVMWEGVIYTLIVIIGPVLAGLVATQTAMNYFNAIAGSAQVTIEPSIATELQSSLMAITAATLIPVGIISGIIGVGGLLLELVLVHFLAVSVFRGHGTIQHLLSTLLGFDNRWLPVMFLIQYLMTAIFFVSAGSPITYCFTIILVILTLYVLGKTSGKIGEAYDFGGMKGCLAYNLSNVIVIGAITAVMYLLFNALGSAMVQSLFQLNPEMLPPLQ
ncbi:MAG: HEAT repeat domain-containing protein [Chloroflexi bacterium]|uniref:HEAT repeat domain-containing protein n=1 Tax=Candidatus Flexifilum breve TaxID=3140694 RepID=UPI00313767E9|nr:HEAT repeat domain-containing protein [Chloroflexota bacterium]